MEAKSNSDQTPPQRITLSVCPNGHVNTQHEKHYYGFSGASTGYRRVCVECNAEVKPVVYIPEVSNDA